MDKLAPLFVIIGAALWGVDGIILRPKLYTISVPLVVFIETGLAVLLMLPFFSKYLPDLKKFKRNDWLAFIGVALFGGVIGTMAITKAIFYVNYIQLSIVVLIQKLQPVFAISLAALLLKERLPKVFFLWGGIALAGAYLLTFGLHLPNLDSGDKTAVAALFALVATVSFAFSTVFSKRALKNVNFKFGTFLRFFFTFLIMALVLVVSGDGGGFNKISAKQWLYFLLIIFSTGAPAIFIYYYGLHHISASVATICELAFPLTAVLLEYLVYGKMLTPVQWLGVFFLLFSIIKVSQIRGNEKNRNPVQST